MKVEEIRAKLLELGMSPEDILELKGKAALTEALAQLEGPIEGALDGLDIDDNYIETEPPDNVIPGRNSPEWSEYVLSLLTDDEKVNGAPKLDGLRRLCELLIGPIISQYSTVVQAPTHATNYIATVMVELQVHDDLIDRTRTVCGVGDGVKHYLEAPYNKYVSSVAESRAEARALRKLLRLKNVVAAEETGNDREDLAGVDEFTIDPDAITATQINLIDVKCRGLDIDVMKFVNAGKNKFASINDISYELAVKICKHINTLQNAVDTIPDSIKGYKPNWREE